MKANLELADAETWAEVYHDPFLVWMDRIPPSEVH